MQQKFIMLGALFSLGAAICNHPHFIITYKFAYSRGLKFILRYWFSLIVVPLSLISLYLIAYLYFDTVISDFRAVIFLNSIFEHLNLHLRIGRDNTLGPELMSFSIWIMYGTVGWHYIKQVYGCIMFYCEFDRYRLSKGQKLWFRYSLALLALYQFFNLSKLFDQSYATSGNSLDSRFPGIHLPTLGLPLWLHSTTLYLMIFGLLGSITIFIYNFKKNKQKPSLLIVTPWVAVYLWWIQFTDLPEFYYMAVPFFHSLQYLPFAIKMDAAKISEQKNYHLKLTLRLVLLFVAGLMVFEFLPTYIDKVTDSEVLKLPFFFTSAFAIFINIHHFFMDSTVWKMSQKEIKNVFGV